MTAPPRRDLRVLHNRQTQELILQAFAECLEQDESDDVSVQAVAQRAGVAARTVYRHFPTRVDLLAAVAEWSRTNLLDLIPLRDLDQLPEVIEQAVGALTRRPNLARAMARSATGREVLSGLTTSIRQQLQTAIDDELADVPEQQRERALGALLCLDSVQSWLVLHDVLEMDADRISDTLGFAVRAVVTAARADAVQPRTLPRGTSAAPLPSDHAGSRNP